MDGKSDRYFNVRNWASLKGLSLLVCGRECDLVTPRSAEERDRFEGHRRRRRGSSRVGSMFCLVIVRRELFGEWMIPGRHHPADGVAAVDIDDHVGWENPTSPARAVW